jgi:hypothetical protein
MSKMLDELKVMSKGLAIALRYYKDMRSSKIQSAYGECLVAQKLMEHTHNVKFKLKEYDLLVDGDVPKRVEVKCGKFWSEEYAKASFRDGKQIEENFDFCVFLIIDEDTFAPKYFFVFKREELNECKQPRIKIKGKGTESALYFFKDLDNASANKFKTRGAKPFDIEKKLCIKPEEFNNKWDKIK